MFDYIASVINLSEEDEVVFTVPVDPYEHYQDWLSRVCENAGILRWRLLDEPSAAALGYGVNIRANDVYLVFDFGGGTLDIAVVKIEGQVDGGKRCRVLGKSGIDLGGISIDNWLYQYILKENRLQQEDILSLSGILLREIEKAKEKLSFAESATVAVTDPNTGKVIISSFTRTQFEDLLDEKGFYYSIQTTIETALKEAGERGITKDHIKAVLLTGGSSLIPSVKKTLTRIFGNKVFYHHPLDSVVLGGAAFAGGIDFYDHIQHNYALRHYNHNKGDYEYEVLVKAGTSYPTEGKIKELTIKAAFDNQSSLGLDIYEVGIKTDYHENVPLDLVFDHNGGVRFKPAIDHSISSSFWMNEKNPTFIKADPPAKKTEARFPTQFSIDGNKRLCVTVFDNLTHKLIMKDHPIIRLS